jgi:GntR family transcriptional regulator/MocR family aminotransferase
MPGSPDVAAFPRAAWLASARRALTVAPTEALRNGDPRGRPELRQALAEYLGRARGVRTSPDAIVICAGTRNAVELLARVFSKHGPIAIEAYGLFIFREAIAAMGVPTTPIGIDEDGAAVDELDRIEAAAALLTPAHFFPHGVPLHPARRTAVIEWSRRTGGYVLEDDYDGEFRYDRQPVGAVQGLDPQRVAYLGSASKSLSPALRLGWMALPDDLVEPVIVAAGGQQFYVNAIDQLTMADFITSGQYDKHIRRMRNSYRRRRDALVQRLQAFDIGISGLSAGLHLLLLLPDDTEHEVLRRAGEAGISLSGLSRLRHPLAGADVPAADGLVVNFGAPADHAFGAAVDALCSVLEASGLRQGARR